MPIFILTASDLAIGGDEEAPLKHGPAHPMPYLAPNWMPPHGENSASSHMADNQAGVAQGMFDAPSSFHAGDAWNAAQRDGMEDVDAM